MTSVYKTMPKKLTIKKSDVKKAMKLAKAAHKAYKQIKKMK